VGEEELAHRCQVQWRAPSDGAHHLHARALAVRALDVHDLVALAHGEVHGLVGQLVQLAHRAQGRIAHVEPRLDEIAEFEQPHAQAIAACFRPVDEAPDRQIVQDAVRRRRMESRLLADELQRHRILVRSKHVEQREHALQHLDGRGLVFDRLHGFPL
jgi:hypothetical protein